jgi:hypothetical protein
MTCKRIEADLVDLARGGGPGGIDPAREGPIAIHVQACSSCAARLERERAISAALERLSRHSDGMAANARTEAAVLAAFDRAWSGSARRSTWPAWASAAAATVLLAVGSAWFPGARPDRHKRIGAHSVATIDSNSQSRESVVITLPSGPSADDSIPVRRQQNRVRRSRPANELMNFVSLPGAAAWPPFESGELMRVELPIGVLPSLGLSAPGVADGFVPADVLVGQDGFARAVRLVHRENNH